MSNRLFQGIIHQMRDSIDRVIGVVDDTATVISCSDLTRIGETSEYLMLDSLVSPMRVRSLLLQRSHPHRGDQ